MGGWITMVQYWSRGFSPWPSPASKIPLPTHQVRKGLSTKEISSRKNASVVISTAATYGIMSRNLRRFWNITTAEYVARSQDHNSSEPSCPPHHAVNL